MSGLFYQSLVLVLGGGSDLDIVGTGVLVSTPQYGPCILTAAHVVNAALGNDVYSTACPALDGRVAFDIPVKGVGPERTYVCAVVEWSRPVRSSERMDTPEGDIALLQVVQEGDRGRKLPGDLALRSVEDLVAPLDEELLDFPLYCFGFARLDGGVVTGRVGGVSVAGWFELQGSQTGSFISPGFSVLRFLTRPGGAFSGW